MCILLTGLLLGLLISSFLCLEATSHAQWIRSEKEGYEGGRKGGEERGREGEGGRERGREGGREGGKREGGGWGGRKE